MGLLNSSKYASLNNLSTASIVGERGPFVCIFISEKPRKNQKPGMMHCLRDWDTNDYVFNDQEKVNFLPLFIKMVRAKADVTKKADGTDSEKLVYFCWDPETDDNYPVGSKCYYIVAGVLLDSEFKPVMSKKDETRAELVYFKCKGTKVGSVIDYLSGLNQKAKELAPLFDDPEFERKVVTPRRFITQATVTTKNTDWGEKYIYIFTPIKKLPDVSMIGSEGKEGIMDRCLRWQDAFKKQFDLSFAIKGAHSGLTFDDEQTTQETPKETPATVENNKVQEPVKTEPVKSQPKEEAEEFNLGLG